MPFRDRNGFRYHQVAAVSEDIAYDPVFNKILHKNNQYYEVLKHWNPLDSLKGYDFNKNDNQDVRGYDKPVDGEKDHLYGNHCWPNECE